MTLLAKTDALPPGERETLSDILHRMSSGETDGIAEMRALLETNPDATEIMGHLAWAEANKGNHEEAIVLYRRRLKIEPDNTEIQWRIADRLINLNQIDEAEAAYREVLDQDPACEDAKMGVRYVAYLRRKAAREGKSDEKWIPGRHKLTRLQRKNRKLNRREYRAQKLRLQSLPPSLYLESTTKCNFFCKTCSKGYAPYYAEDLQDSIKEKVRREVMPTNARISITGFGEPTLAGDFDDILHMSVENGSLVHFVTNASLLNFERIEKLTRTPVDITISFDGATRETFESVRDGSNFNLILEKLAMIKKLRDIHLSQVSSSFCFNFVALRKNIDELPDVVRIAHRYGMMHVGVADYAFNDNEFDEESLRYEPDRANAAIARARALAEELGVSLQTPPEYLPVPPPLPQEPLWRKVLRTRRLFPEKNRFPARCNSPWSEPYIHTDGTVTPCCASNDYLGDLKKQSFEEIWNGWRYRLLRWRIHSIVPPNSCRRCFVCWGINGGNHGNVMGKEGLLIKAFYWSEIRINRVWEKLKHRWNQRRVNAPSPTDEASCSSEPAPNYYKGRPMTEKNRPT